MQVRRVRVRQRWGRLALRLRVRGARDGAFEAARVQAAEEEAAAAAAEAEALAYAGLRVLASGETLNVFDAAQALLQLQARAPLAAL